MTPAEIRRTSLRLDDRRWRSRLRLRGDAAAPGLGSDDVPTMEVDGDLVRQRYRYFSADTDLLGHFMRSPSPEILRAAAAKWSDQLVRADHTASVQALIGQTLSDAEWVDGAPGGVEGTIEFDRVLNPTVVRGIERGLLGAVSSVVDVTWVPSHEGMDEDTFWERLGEVVDGEVVTRVIDSIDGVYGVDVVDFGADPQAHRMQSAGSAPAQEYDMMDRIRERLDLAASVTDDETMEVLEARLTEAEADHEWGQTAADLCAMLAVEVMDPAALVAAVTRTVAAAAKVDALTAEVESLRSQVPSPVDEALAAGRIAPAQADALRRAYEAAPDAVTEYLAGLADGTAVPLGRQAPVEAPTVQVTARQRAIADTLGVPVEDLIAEMDRRNK